MKVTFEIATPPAVTATVAIGALFAIAIIAMFKNPPTDAVTPTIITITIITITTLWKPQYTMPTERDKAGAMEDADSPLDRQGNAM